MKYRHNQTINRQLPILLVFVLLFIAGFSSISDAYSLNPSLTAQIYHYDPDITPSFKDNRVYTHSLTTKYDAQLTNRTRAPPEFQQNLHQARWEYIYETAEGSTVATENAITRGNSRLESKEWFRSQGVWKTGRISKKTGQPLGDIYEYRFS